MPCFSQNSDTITSVLQNIDKYGEEQIEAIFWGFLKGVDISRYSSAGMPAIKMKNIYWILEKEEEFSKEQLEVLYEGCMKGVSILSSAKPDFSVEQMRLILKGLEEGIDVYNFANPKLSIEQMQFIYQCEQDGLDTSRLSNPALTMNQMRLIHFALSHSLYADTLFEEFISTDDDSYREAKSIIPLDEDKMKEEIRRQMNDHPSALEGLELC